MKRFTVADTFAPVDPPNSKVAQPTQEITVGQRLGMSLIGLVFIAVGGLLAFNADGDVFSGLLFAVPGALLAYASLRRTGASHSRTNKVGGYDGAAIFGAVTLVPAALTVMYARSGEMLAAAPLGAFTALFAMAVVNMTIQTFRQNRVAKVLAAARASSASAPSPAVGSRGSAMPPVELVVYLLSELPELPHPYRPLTAEANVIGLPPSNILYLYNFFDDDPMLRKMQGNWRRFGHIWLPGSPGDLAQSTSLLKSVATATSSQVLRTPEEFEQGFRDRPLAPLMPGDPELRGASRLSGGYPETMFLCGDGSWQHAVERLLGAADYVLIDAGGYSEERAGLGWEIRRVLDQCDTHDFVILVDDDADQEALYRTFVAAWSEMSESSPNNRPDAGPIQWVRMNDYAPEGYQAPVVKVGEDLDPGHLMHHGLVGVVDQLHMNRALAEDRIYGLFLR